MNNTAKKIKEIIKGTAPKSTFGTNPNDPWSAKYGLAEGALEQYLLSRGINPKFVSKDTKISHAKSSEFLKWKNDHQFESVQEETDKKDTVCMDIPLLIRVLEFTREQMKSDIELHNMVERLINMRHNVPLDMTHYDAITQKLVKENHIAIAMGKMLDDEGGMVLSQIEQLERAITMIRSYVGKDYEKQLPAWVQAKVTLATDYIDTVGNYLISKNEKVSEETNLDEATKKLSGADKWRQHIDSVQKKHNEFMKSLEGKSHSEKMKSMMDKIQSNLNKEETLDETSKDKVERYLSKIGDDDLKKHGMKPNMYQRLEPKRQKGVDRALDRLSVKEVVQHDPWKQKYFGPHTVVSKRKMSDKEKSAWEKHKEWRKGVDDALASDMKRINKEEVELNEDNLDSIAKKHDMEFKRTTYGAGMKHKTKGEVSINRYGEWHHYPSGSKSSKAHGNSEGNFSSLDKHLSSLKEEVGVSEDIYQDGQAPTQTSFDGANSPDNTEPSTAKVKAGMSKSARMIKALYKHHNMKEELFDGEKEDKSVATYGKKPKMIQTKPEDNLGDNIPQAAAVLKGGKTLTGQTRDTLEIDPEMKRPTRPDAKLNGK